MTRGAGAGATSRRQLLKVYGTGLVAGTTAALAGCGAKTSKLRAAPPSVRDLDVAILNRALDLEFETISAYTAGIPLLDRSAQAAAQQFLSQELSHAGELGGLVREAGGKAHKAKPAYELGHPRSHREVLGLLHRLEQAQIALYLDAIPRVSPGPVRAALAAIVGNDAQHISVLRPALGLSPMPAALVTGAE